MRKILKGIVMAFGIMFLMLLGSCVLLVSCGESETTTPVVIEEDGTEIVYEDKNELYNALVQDIEWEFINDGFGNVEVIGVLENTTNEKIDYIEIEYKFIKEDITVQSSFECETDIEPGEKVQITIYAYEEFDAFTVEGSTGWE